ncbi:MAG: response regulator transcription factor [Pseudomonadota bacterium]
MRMMSDFEVVIAGNTEAPELKGLEFLFQSLGYTSSVISNPFDHNFLQEDKENRLILVDWPTYQTGAYSVPNVCNELLKDHRVALLHVERNKFIETNALQAGLDGVFFNDERPDVVVKGVGAIVKGQLWFSRTVLSEVVNNLLVSSMKDKHQTNEEQIEALKSLTQRERAVIGLLTRGARNKEIATELNISAHTVKAHVYSIFKKTNSRNRVEVINWANQHQLHLMSSSK